MPKTLRDLARYVEARARAQGPAAEAELAALLTQAQLARLLLDGRLARGLTQQQLADQSGVPQSEISKIENARANPTVATLAAITRPLGLQLDVRPTSFTGALIAGTWTASQAIVPPAIAPAFRPPGNLHMHQIAA